MDQNLQRLEEVSFDLMNIQSAIRRFIPMALGAACAVLPVTASHAAEQTTTPASSSANEDESKVAPYTLPELLKFNDGSDVKTFADWENRRRDELLITFRSEVFGFSPPKPEALSFRTVTSDPIAMEGQATRKQVEISFQLSGQTFAFPLTLFVPNDRKSPAPVFLLLNHRPAENADPTREKRMDFWPAESLIARGYAIAAINVAADVEPDKREATTGLRTFYRQHFAHSDTLTWGALAAWSWAGSRVMDYFETDRDINTRQVAIIGHSRGGKAALWAAAQDPRFALACVNQSGEGGAALSRRNYGETLEMITKSCPHWFVPGYAGYAGKEETLPIDQHELIALIAPRGYHGGEGKLDTWSDPRGSWLSLVEASRAWALAGKIAPWVDRMPAVDQPRKDGPLAYHLRDGGHDLTAPDWKFYLDHADSLFSH